MPSVRRVDGSSLKLRLNAQEAGLLRQVVNEITQIIGGDATTAIHDRLFPDAFDDPEETQRYNALVHDELKAHKLRALDTIRNTLGDTGRVSATLPPDEAHLWLTALTDIRLALGVRLEVSEEDMGREPDPDDPNAPAMAVLHWLGWLQEIMVENLDPFIERT
ncbi:MAG: DUF2017 domain-containing protein [Actinomycetota bacterium]|nr:DUF2017 domain-containing protein [Actinomycetota bacterium]